MKYGYARVSSVGQDLTIQVQTLKDAGCDVVREEKVSGTSLNGRTELQTLMEFMRDGDELVVTRIDRLARSIRDLQNLVHELKQRGVTLSATEQPIDTKTSAGKAFLDMLGVFSEFETNLRKERQMEGVRKAKELGVYKGTRQDNRCISNLRTETEWIWRNEDFKRVGHHSAVCLSSVEGTTCPVCVCLTLVVTYPL